MLFRCRSSQHITLDPKNVLSSLLRIIIQPHVSCVTGSNRYVILIEDQLAGVNRP